MTISYLLHKQTNSKIPYQVLVGLDPGRTLLLESQWSAAKAKVIDILLTSHKNEINNQAALLKRLTEYNLNDFHWSWTNKALTTATDEYQWFYLDAENEIQGVCIIYHPKTSRIDARDIFYIDYIASAYWNRDRPNHTKRFSNVGGILIAESINYSIHVLGLRPGFCLHSLASAESYYKKIGMLQFSPDPSYLNLKYFEANEICALNLTKDSHVK